MKNKYLKSSLLSIIGWIVVFIVLFSYLQIKGRYNLYFMEQWQIFLYDWPFVTSVLWQPGGMVRLISDFLVQFFVYDCFGALIFAFLLTLIGFFTASVLKQLASASHFSVLALLPVISLLFLQFNLNYQFAGTTAFLLFVIGLNYYLKMRSLWLRVLFDLCTSLILYLLAGPIASMFVVSVLLIELFTHFRSSYLFLIPGVIVYLSAEVSLRLGVTGEIKYLLLPDGYFGYYQKAVLMYQTWALILALLPLALLLRWVKTVKKSVWQAGLVFQLTVIGGFVFFCMSSMIDTRNETFKELEHYISIEDWDMVLKRSEGKGINNYLCQNCRNLALAEKGKLAENLFDYPQAGIQNIILNWDKTVYVSALLSDVFFSMGLIAKSQRMAFESSGNGNNYNPSMLKRLVQTNLIFGNYRVAEKYITLLEKTQHYRKWAHSQRQFLDNDSTVEADSLLSAKRRCLFPEKTISGNDGINTDLKHIIDHNPSHRASIQYLGAIYLLIKDIHNFKGIVERYYGTPALPYLPKAFQECMMLFTATDAEILEHYDISDEVVHSYKAFRTLKTDQVVQEYQAILNHKIDKQATYWHYLLCYKKNN
ncbi:MAG: hypothetical protein JJE17_03785 [Peptostreptococcaceae bacterium]|nr:hypothetical protein [Peptostreptococcaceae bacterium]